MDEKINLGVGAFLYPMPVVLVGTEVEGLSSCIIEGLSSCRIEGLSSCRIEGRANFMAVAWATRVNGNPPIMGVALNQRHHTPAGIRACESFSINIPNVDMAARTDYCGLVSGRETDKSGVFETFYGELGTAPMIVECPLCIECKLVDVVSLPSHDLFLGEVVAVFADKDCLSEGKPDIHKIHPFVLTMPDNRYWAIGEQIGNAWSIGQHLKR